MRVMRANVHLEKGDPAVSATHKAEVPCFFNSIYLHDGGTIPDGAPNLSTQRIEYVMVITQETTLIFADYLSKTTGPHKIHPAVLKPIADIIVPHLAD